MFSFSAVFTSPWFAAYSCKVFISFLRSNATSCASRFPLRLPQQQCLPRRKCSGNIRPLISTRGTAPPRRPSYPLEQSVGNFHRLTDAYTWQHRCEIPFLFKQENKHAAEKVPPEDCVSGPGAEGYRNTSGSPVHKLGVEFRDAAGVCVHSSGFAVCGSDTELQPGTGLTRPWAVQSHPHGQPCS